MHRLARRLTVAALCLSAVACGEPSVSGLCTTIGSKDGMAVVVPKAAGAGVERLRLELCQRDTCEQVELPVASAGSTRTQGVARMDLPGQVIYEVVPAAVDQRWTRSAARVEVTGFGSRGGVVLRHHETFRFEVFSPNGPDCEPHALRHAVRLSVSDRV